MAEVESPSKNSTSPMEPQTHTMVVQASMASIVQEPAPPLASVEKPSSMEQPRPTRCHLDATKAMEQSLSRNNPPRPPAMVQQTPMEVASPPLAPVEKPSSMEQPRPTRSHQEATKAVEQSPSRNNRASQMESHSPPMVHQMPMEVTPLPLPPVEKTPSMEQPRPTHCHQEATTKVVQSPSKNNPASPMDHQPPAMVKQTCVASIAQKPPPLSPPEKPSMEEPQMAPRRQHEGTMAVVEWSPSKKIHPWHFSHQLWLTTTDAWLVQHRSRVRT
jgi:hypothetical protein